MTDKNSPGMPRSYPGGARHPARDALDDIDEAVAQITNGDIEDRLYQILGRAGRGPCPALESSWANETPPTRSLESEVRRMLLADETAADIPRQA